MRRATWSFVRRGAQVYGTLAGGKVSHETGGTAQNNIVVIESEASIGSSAQSTATVNAGIGTSANSNAVYVFRAAYGNVYGGQATKKPARPTTTSSTLAAGRR